MGRRRKGDVTYAQTSMRLPAKLLERADALAQELDLLPEHGHERATRATVLRVALALGLRELERRVGKARE
jgi:predicted DNA-binding protein